MPYNKKKKKDKTDKTDLDKWLRTGDPKLVSMINKSPQKLDPRFPLKYRTPSRWIGGAYAEYIGDCIPCLNTYCHAPGREHRNRVRVPAGVVDDSNSFDMDYNGFCTVQCMNDYMHRDGYVQNASKEFNDGMIAMRQKHFHTEREGVKEYRQSIYEYDESDDDEEKGAECYK